MGKRYQFNRLMEPDDEKNVRLATLENAFFFFFFLSSLIGGILDELLKSWLSSLANEDCNPASYIDSGRLEI